MSDKDNQLHWITLGMCISEAGIAISQVAQIANRLQSLEMDAESAAMRRCMEALQEAESALCQAAKLEAKKGATTDERISRAADREQKLS